MAYAHELDDDEKRELLRIARATLREFLASGRTPPGKPHKKTLLEEAAAFVTLRRGEELRGCIGSVEAERPLYKAVQEMAIAAASRDTRFSPLGPDELDDITIEISVLGNHRAVTDLTELQIGRDGLILSARGQRGLLLPQVASEQGWDADTFADRVCAKAGLPGGSWREEGAELQSFTAQVFDENSHPMPRPPSMP